MKRSDVIWAGAAVAVLWLWWRSRPRRALTMPGVVEHSTGLGDSPAPLPADTPLSDESAQRIVSRPATVAGKTVLSVQDVPTAEETPDETPIAAETMSPTLRNRQTVADADGLSLSEQLSNPFTLTKSTPTLF